MKESHELKSEKLHRKILSEMTPEQKWEQVSRLYTLAWELKVSGLRAQNPDWSEERIQDTVRRIFLHGHT